MQTLPLSGTDIVVQSADGDLLAVVEIRNPIELSPEYAATIRRDLIEHRRVNRAARFFLVLSQDIGYLWDQNEFPEVRETPPTVTFSMTPVIRHYRPERDLSDRLTSSSLERIVKNWFWDLAVRPQNRPTEIDSV